MRFETFPDEVRRHFAFLGKEHGFTGPTEDSRLAILDRSMTCTSSGVTVDVSLALGPASDQNVLTTLELRTRDERIRVDVAQVFVAAGLGPVNRVGIGAQTRRAMAKSIAAQGIALRQVLPLVLGPGGSALARRTPGSRRWPLTRPPGPDRRTNSA